MTRSNAGKVVDGRTTEAAPQRAGVLRTVAHVLSADVPVRDLWPRCIPPIAAMLAATRVTVVLRGDSVDAIAYCSDDELGIARGPVARESLAHDVLHTGETVQRADPHAVGVPVRFGRTLIGAIVFEGTALPAPDDLAMLESCALYIGARIHHETALETSRRYERLALIDGLTGVANRRNFDEALAREWSRSARDGSPLAVAIVDLDYFKPYNDNYGHQAGDLCLKNVARALGDCLKRPADVFARYGGEEFVALLPGTDLAGVTALAETFRETVGRLGIAHAASSLGVVSLSAGVAAMTPAPDGTPDALIAAADAALYRAKIAGRNRVTGGTAVAESPAAHRVRASAPSNIPIAATRFVGRRAETAATRALLDEHRLVTILGVGGAGKTRIAQHVANQVADEYADGAWFVDLAPIADPTLVASTIGALFGATIPADARGYDALIPVLATRRALLVLDNCEHVIDGVAKVAAAIVRNAPDVRVIATSREPLGITGEAVYRLPLLALPAVRSDLSAADAGRFDAIALFVERARAVNRSFTLTDENAPVVASIVHNVDGLALAVELAAARLGAIGLDALAARLGESLRELAGGDRTVQPRRQTMRATIAWSYDLLTEREQLVFRRLAVFAGAFTLDAATAVCGDGRIASADVFDVLVALIRKSLVVDDPAGADDHFVLLDSIRAYARERLADDADAYALRHARHYLTRAQAAAANYISMPSREWFTLEERNVANYRAAMEWALRPAGDFVLGARLAAALGPLFTDYAAVEGVRWLRRALEALPPGRDDATAAMLWYRLAGATRVLTAAELREASERTIELARKIGERELLANALRVLAQTLGWFFREERELADAYACEAIDIARTTGPALLIADCLKTRGLTIDFSDIAQKRAVLEESLALFRLHGNDRQIGSALTWISDFEFSAGDEARALAYGRDAVRYAEAAGMRGLQETATINLAMYASAVGDWETAKRAATAGLTVARESRATAGITYAIQALASVIAAAGDAPRAARLVGFCDSRTGIEHSPRQADQCEEIAFRRLLATLDAALGAEEFARERAAGLRYDEAAAVREALTDAF